MMRAHRQMTGWSLVLFAGGLLAAAPVWAASGGYEAPVDPRDIVNPTGGAYTPPPPVNYGGAYTPPAGYAGAGVGTVTEISRTTYTEGVGRWVDTNTGELIPERGAVTNAAARPTPEEINREYGNNAPAPAPATAEAASGRRWTRPWTLLKRDENERPASTGGGGAYEQPTGADRSGYEYNPPRPAPSPYPAPAPAPYPTPSPYPTVATAPLDIYNAPPSLIGGAACDEFEVVGIDQGVPPGIGIQLPSGSNAQVTVREVPFSGAPVPGTGGSVYGTPYTPPMNMPAPGGVYTSTTTTTTYTAPVTVTPVISGTPVYGDPLPFPGGTVTPTPVTPRESFSEAGRAAFERAKDLMRREQYGEALREIENALVNEYATAEVFRWRGDGQYNLLRLEDAIVSYGHALELDPNSYFARRGRGLAHLHLGHQRYSFQLEARARGDRDAMVRYFNEAHENYRTALRSLRECIAERPNDPDTIYGLAMAAEGTSRAYFSLAISNLRNQNRAEADAAANECLGIINEGLKFALMRYEKFGKDGDTREIGPLTVAGGLFLRQAKLQYAFGNTEPAIVNVNRAIQIQHTILNADPNNRKARADLEEFEAELRNMTGA